MKSVLFGSGRNVHAFGYCGRVEKTYFRKGAMQYEKNVEEMDRHHARFSAGGSHARGVMRKR